MADSEAEVIFGANITGITAGITQVRELLKGLTEPINGIREGLGELADAFIVAFAVEKIGKFAEGMAELGLQTTKASEILGISTDEVGGLGLIAKASGVQLGSLEMAFGRMSRNIIEGSGQTKRAFDALGLSMASFRNLTPETQLETLATKFQGIKSGADADAIAMALLGRAGVEMLPLLDQGAEGIRKWSQAAGELGVSLGKDVVAAMEQTHEQLTLLGAAFQGAGVQTFLEFNGVINGTVQIVRDLTAAFTDAMRTGGFVKDTMNLIGTIARGLVASFAGLIEALRIVWDTAVFAVDSVVKALFTMGDAIVDVFNALAKGTNAFFAGLVSAAREAALAVGTIFSNLGSVISAGMHGDLAGVSSSFDKLKSDAAASGSAIAASLKSSVSGFDMTRVANEFNLNNAKMEASTKQYMNAITKDLQDGQNEMLTIFGLGDQKIEAEHDQHNVRMAGKEKAAKAASNKDALDAAMKEIEGEIKLLQAGLKQKTTILDAEVAQHQITQNAKFAALEGYTQKEYEAELALLQKELALDGLKVTQKQEINNKIAALQAKHDEDMIKLDEQAIAAAQKQWEGYLTTIQSSWDGQLQGLLSGTTKFSQAMGNILQGLVIKAIEGIEKMAVEWAAAEVAKTTASTTGAAARAAANVAADTTTSISAITSIIKSIAASAAQTFAGIFGFLSPVLGPAAAAPAIAGQATVLAAGATIASHAQGSWSLPSDMVSMVHAGEMIVPAGPAANLRAAFEGGGGGGGSGGGGGQPLAVHFNVSAIDQGGVKSFFHNNGDHILSSINSALRGGGGLKFSMR